MAVERLEFEVTANVSRLKTALTSELVDASVKGAEGMADAVDKGVATATSRIQSRFRSAFSGLGTTFEATAKKIQSSNLISQLETIGSLGIQVGGNISRLSSIFTSLVRPVAIVATAFGPIPLVLAASTVAAVALGAALVGIPAALASMGTAAGAAGDRLGKLGALTAEQAEFARDMREATQAATVAQDRLTLALAEGASAVAEMRYAVTGFRAGITDVALGAGTVMSSIDALAARAIAAVPIFDDLGASMFDFLSPTRGRIGVNPILNAALEGLAQRGRDAKAEIEALNGALASLSTLRDATRDAAELSNTIGEFVGPVYDAGYALRKKAQAAREAAAADREASAAAAAVRAEYLAINDAALASRLNLTKISLERKRLLSEEAEAYAEVAREAENARLAAVAAVAAVEDRFNEYFGTLGAAADRFAYLWNKAAVQISVNTFQVLADTTSSVLSSLQQIEQAQIDALTERAQKQTDRLTTIAEKQHDNSVDALRDLRDEGRISEGVYKQKIREANNLYTKRKVLADLADEDERILANKAFRRQQNYQIGQAAIAAAVSAVALIPALAYLAWGAPVAAAGLASAAFGVQVAAIKTQQPPEFPVGTRLGQPSPDHHTIAVQEREAVLSRRAVEGIGGVEAVDALNRGAGGMAQEIVVALDRREIARAMVMAGHAAPDRRRGKRTSIRGRRGAP